MVVKKKKRVSRHRSGGLIRFYRYMNEQQGRFYYFLFQIWRRMCRRTTVEKLPGGRKKIKWRSHPQPFLHTILTTPRFLTRSLLVVIMLLVLLFLLFGEAMMQESNEAAMMTGVDPATVDQFRNME